MGAQAAKLIPGTREEQQLLRAITESTCLPKELTQIIYSYLQHSGVKLLVGSGKSGRKVECFDSGAWFLAPSPIRELIPKEVFTSLSDCRVFPSASSDEIFLINFIDPSFVRLNFVTHKLTRLPLPLSEANYYSVMPTMASAGGRCFFVGGAQEIEFMVWEGASKNVQYFDDHRNLWVRTRPMAVGRVSPGVAGVGDNIYVLGGSDSNGVHLSSVEHYNVQTNKWKMLPPMTTPRTKFAACIWNNRLYAFGGDQSGTFAEYWVIGSDNWVTSTKMIAPLGGHFGEMEVVSGDDCIYVCAKNAGSIYCYHPLQDSWEKIPSPTRCKRIQVAMPISYVSVDII